MAGIEEERMMISTEETGKCLPVHRNGNHNHLTAPHHRQDHDTPTPHGTLRMPNEPSPPHTPRRSREPNRTDHWTAVQSNKAVGNEKWNAQRECKESWKRGTVGSPPPPLPLTNGSS